MPRCSNSRLKAKSEGKDVSFYRIPAGDSRRRKWLHLIRRGGGWQIRPWHRICSEHFVPGMLRKTDDYRLYRTNVVSLRTRTLAYSILCHLMQINA